MIEIVNIKELKPHPSNPRFIRDEKYQKLKQSILDFPEMLQLRPLIVNNDLVVLGGNMRLKVCSELGYKEVPIIRAENLTPEQQKTFMLKDNADYGEWDWTILAGDEWKDEVAEHWGNSTNQDWNNIEQSDTKYNPVLNPAIMTGDVTRQQLDDKSKEMMNQMKRETNYKNLICPHCGEEFSISADE